NRQSDTEEIQARVRLTPLTTFVVRAQAIQDRFDNALTRNADSVSIVPGFELRPEALISGEVFAGVRRFTTLSDAEPDYTGIVAHVRARYVLASTRVAINVSRDVAYSYETTLPYYTLTDAGLEITQLITGSWDLVARGSRQSLAYRTVTPDLTPERTDTGWMAGAGIGYRIGETLRIGVDVNDYTRTVNGNEARSYRGLRAGASISYGLPR
ncbi:MAG: outer membrane beta-barrel protein, partial [Vicinamibacterales bacterium]